MRTHSLIPFAILGAASIVAACGGSSDGSTNGNGGSQSPPVTTGGGTDAGHPDSGSADAGADVQSGPVSDQYPAPHPLPPVLKNYGGPVISDMKLITVTFKGDASRDTYRQFNDAIVKTTYWTSVLGQYGVHAGTGGTYAELDDTVSNKTLDNNKDLIPMLQQLVMAGTLPAPDANTLYAIHFPSSTTITLDGAQSCQAFGGYHDYGAFTVGGKTVKGAFAVLPECGGKPVSTVTATHEFMEAATDPYPFTSPMPPDPFTWYVYDDAWFGNGGGEIGDACEGRGSYSEPTTMQTVALGWSNAAVMAGKNPCQPADPSKIYFGAAFDTDTVTGVQDTTGGGPSYDSKGYVLMKKGDSRDIDVSVFSEAKLPHDLTLSVLGVDKMSGSTSPTITQGVTSTLSQTTGNNGSKVKLSIKIDPSATAGDYPFLVRATLEANDYHSWFGILRVQ